MSTTQISERAKAGTADSGTLLLRVHDTLQPCFAALPSTTTRMSDPYLLKRERAGVPRLPARFRARMMGDLVRRTVRPVAVRVSGRVEGSPGPRGAVT